MNTFTSNENHKANKVRTSLLLCINAEWTKLQKKPQMLINSRSPIKIRKSYDSFEINITNPREYGGVVSSIQNSNMIQMITSPDWSEFSISRCNSVTDEDFQLQKYSFSHKKLINPHGNIIANNNDKKDFEQKKTMNEVMKQGFRALRKIAKELKVCKGGGSNKKKSPEKRDSKKKVSLFKKHQTDNEDKPKIRLNSNKNLNTFNDKEQNNNYNNNTDKFMKIKSKTAFIGNKSIDVNIDTNSNDNNYIIKTRSRNSDSKTNNILSLHYRPNGVKHYQSPPKLKNNKIPSKSPIYIPKNYNKPISFGINGQIIRLKGCSAIS